MARYGRKECNDAIYDSLPMVPDYNINATKNARIGYTSRFRYDGIN